MLLDFLPVDENRTIDVQAKKSFILQSRTIPDFLEVDPRSPYDPARDEEGKVIHYKLPSMSEADEPTRVLKITKTPERYFNMEYFELKGDDLIEFENARALLTAGEMIVMQKLIESTLPAIVGWHALYNPEMVEM